MYTKYKVFNLFYIWGIMVYLIHKMTNVYRKGELDEYSYNAKGEDR